MFKQAVLLFVLTLFVPLCSIGCRPRDTAVVSVPRGKPDVIDGTMAPGEWEQAHAEALADGSELFLVYDQGYLYVGIRSTTPERATCRDAFLNRSMGGDSPPLKGL